MAVCVTNAMLGSRRIGAAKRSQCKKSSIIIIIVKPPTDSLIVDFTNNGFSSSKTVNSHPPEPKSKTKRGETQRPKCHLSKVDRTMCCCNG